MPRFNARQKKRYYGGHGTVSEEESRDMWKERARRTEALSKRGWIE